MKKLSSVMIVALIIFSACSEPEEQVVPAPQLKSYQSGTNNGWFWSLWKDDQSGYVTYTNGSGGNYSVAWNYAGNFTCGKGWSTGSRTRRIGYNCGAYTCNGGGVFAYYGWTRSP